MLVLIHGTFVETVSTFGKLWVMHPQRVRELFTAYGGRVYALDHPTLGASPIANALTLVQALPQGARLHLATHSRGGLVAEVLARVAGQPRLTADDLAFFAGAGLRRPARRAAGAGGGGGGQGHPVERVVRVACPARGTLLASKRLDAYLSVLKWSLDLAGVPVVPALVDFLTEVARRRADPAEIPGLAAMIPGTPLVNWLNAAEEPMRRRPARGRRRPAGRLGDELAQDAAGRRLLLDRQRHRRADALDVRRRAARGRRELPARPGRHGHALQLLSPTSARWTRWSTASRRPQPAGFRPIGPLSWAGQDSGGVRAARRARAATGPAGERPAVFVLPGILGSNLAAGGKRIWLSLRLIGGLSQAALPARRGRRA